MKWSWRLGQIAGIDVYVHATFALLLAYVGFVWYQNTHRWLDTLLAMGFILVVFFIIVLHELGHALAARRFGIATRDITLLPIGGVARLERMPEDPKQELVVALAGPLVNVVIAASLYIGILISGELYSWDLVLNQSGGFLSKLMILNIVLAVFNMIPAFPMDGGRVLRALLARKLDYVVATNVAASIGQGLALTMLAVGLLVFRNPFMIFVALFVWVGAENEANMVRMNSLLSGIPIQKVMLTQFRTLSPRDSLASVVDLTLSGFQQDFPVVEDGKLLGMVTRGDLLLALAKPGHAATVGDMMHTDVKPLDPRQMLDRMADAFEHGHYQALPVVRDGQLVGMITLDHLAEILTLRKAMKKQVDNRNVI